MMASKPASASTAETGASAIALPQVAGAPPHPATRTLGELKAAGLAKPEGIKDELRRNLIAALRSPGGLAKVFAGIVGYEKTVLPQVVNAVLARHDLLLLGLRGQAKTRLARALVRLLDVWTPVVAGSELNEHPARAILPQTRELLAQRGDATPIAWLHASHRYGEKLATPDVSVADLVGDVDPIRAAAAGLPLNDLRSVSFGIIPRTNRGIFCINELPDLPPRIQVALFNILEESDVQVRGIPLRLDLDLMLCFTANPEDYTSRGQIITPLKDRIAAQILTHYPKEREQGIAIVRQEAWIDRASQAKVEIAPLFLDLIEECARAARSSEYVDASSGVSARLTIAAYETLVSNVERRGLVNNEAAPHARMVDLLATVAAMTGKIELAYEGEQEGPLKVARHAIGQAFRTLWRDHLPSVLDEDERPLDKADNPFSPVLRWFGEGNRLRLDDQCSDAEHSKRLHSVPKLFDLVDKLVKPVAAERELWADFIIEGLFWCGALAREEDEQGVIFTDLLAHMMSRKTGKREDGR